ncbi:MAG: lactate utilization protein [Anaerolineae bacterium]|nr:lactate utilization protein [Anaerolineae bacterium]
MTSSREQILNKLRAAQQPFPDAPPRPKEYMPVAPLDDATPDGLLQRFSFELDRVMGQVFPVGGDEGARTCVLDLLRGENATHILSWDFKYIPVAGLEAAIREAGIEIIHPEMHDEFREETIESIRGAQVGLAGVDAAIAATGTMVFSTAPGKGRLPTVIAPMFIAVITIDQLLPRLEDWVAQQRANNLDLMWKSSNICFNTGPSRTADIEMQMILGVHGPGKLRVIVKR